MTLVFDRRLILLLAIACGMPSLPLDQDWVGVTDHRDCEFVCENQPGVVDAETFDDCELACRVAYVRCPKLMTAFADCWLGYDLKWLSADCEPLRQELRDSCETELGPPLPEYGSYR